MISEGELTGVFLLRPRSDCFKRSAEGRRSPAQDQMQKPWLEDRVSQKPAGQAIVSVLRPRFGGRGTMAGDEGPVSQKRVPSRHEGEKPQ